MEHNRISNKFEQIRESMCRFLFVCLFVVVLFWKTDFNHSETWRSSLMLKQEHTEILQSLIFDLFDSFWRLTLNTHGQNTTNITWTTEGRYRDCWLLSQWLINIPNLRGYKVNMINSLIKLNSVVII